MTVSFSLRDPPIPNRKRCKAKKLVLGFKKAALDGHSSHGRKRDTERRTLLSLYVTNMAGSERGPKETGPKKGRPLAYGAARSGRGALPPKAVKRKQRPRLQRRPRRPRTDKAGFLGTCRMGSSRVARSAGLVARDVGSDTEE